MRVKIRGEKLKVLGYADDLVWFGGRRRGYEMVIKKERYCDEKELVINMGKTKIIR